MTVNNLPAFTIEEASKRGQDVYEVIFENWGDSNVGVEENSSYPPGDIVLQKMLAAIPISLAAIALGPRSTVDRVWVSYDLQKKRSGGGAVHSTDRVRRLSVEAPLLYTQAAQSGYGNLLDYSGCGDPAPNANGVQNQQGLLYVYAAVGFTTQGAGINPPYSYPFHQASGAAGAPGAMQDTTVVPEGYLKINGVDEPFIDQPLTTVFMPPRLHLLLYLKKPIASPPIARFPLLVSGTVVSTGNTEWVIAQIPIYGRKHVRISARCDSNATLRCAVIRAINEDSTLVWETDSKTSAITAITVGEVQYDHPCADYLAVYLTVPAGAGHNGLFSVAAYD